MENHWTPYLTYFKLCASFHSYWSIQTVVTVQKRQIWVQIGIFFRRVTLIFERWHWKIIGHLFYATSSFWYHFTGISQYKLELQSGNAKFRSKSVIFLSHVTLRFDRWPWKTIGHLIWTTSSFVHLGQNQKFFAPVTLKFDRWPWKATGHLFYATSSCVHDFIAICEFKLELQSRNGQIGFDFCDLDLWPLTLTFCMDITSAHGNNSWTFHDDMMMGT